MPSYVEGCTTHADQDLHNRVLKCLSERHVPSLRNLTVEVDKGRVLLSGKLRSFHEKQLCTTYCRRVPGVVNLVDNTEVSNAQLASV